MIHRSNKNPPSGKAIPPPKINDTNTPKNHTNPEPPIQESHSQLPPPSVTNASPINPNDESNYAVTEL